MNYEFWDVRSEKKIVVSRLVVDRDKVPTFEEVQADSTIEMTQDEYDGSKWERVFTGGSGWTRGPTYGTQKKGCWGSND